jgi:purine-binding chemotaxis protein CheW
VSASAIKRQEEKRLCTFYLDDERYGIDILTVREIQRGSRVTPARGAHAWVRGLVNLRGQIVTVIDPAIRMGFAPREFGPQSRIVILKTNAELPQLEGGVIETGEDRVGLCVDRIADVHTVEDDTLDPLPPAADGTGQDELLSGVIQLPGEVIRVMNPAAMLRLEGDA